MTDKKEERIEKLDYPSLVSNQIQRITKIASQELTGGYEKTTRTEIGGQVYVEQTYIPDTREMFNNSVNMLADLTFPHFSKEMKETEITLNKELESHKEECMKKDHRGKEELDKDKFAELKLENRKKLFRELCSFVKKCNYFMEDIE